MQEAISFFEFGESGKADGLFKFLKEIRDTSIAFKEHCPYDQVCFQFLIGDDLSGNYHSLFSHIYSLSNLFFLCGAKKGRITLSAEFHGKVQTDMIFGNNFNEIFDIHFNENTNYENEEYLTRYNVPEMIAINNIASENHTFLEYFGVKFLTVPVIRPETLRSPTLNPNAGFRDLLEKELKGYVVNLNQYKVDTHLMNLNQKDDEHDPMDSYTSDNAWDDAFGDAPESAIGHW